MSVLSTVLQLESEMNTRKEKLDAAHSAVRREGVARSPNQKVIAILNDEIQGYQENWLNAADRLAYCILRGYLSERDWKNEYRDFFRGLAKEYESSFGPATKYTDIVDLNHKWMRE